MSNRFPRPHPFEWFCLFCGVILSFYYSWIMDDAYIYLRYADNFVFLRRGLVFNPGEHVEGTGSPLWLLFWVLVRSIRLNYWLAIRILAVSSYLAVWVLAVIINRKLSKGKAEVCTVNYPLINLTFTYGVLCYYSSGLETPLVQIASLAYAAFLLFPHSAILQAIIAVSPLIRQELILPFFAVFIWYIFAKKAFPWRLFLISAVALGSWVVFRIYYYADLLPNVYYLKNITDIRQGLCYVYDTALAYCTLPILFFFFFLSRFIKRNDPGENLNVQARVMMLVAALSVLLYVVKIGGDARHFRYLAFSYCLVMAATGGLIERGMLMMRLQNNRRLIFAIALNLALFSFMCYPKQLLHHPILRKNLLIQKSFLKINDAAVHRILSPPLLSFGNERELFPKMEQFVKEGKTIATSDVKIGDGCREEYENFESFYIHLFGETDPFLARTVMYSDYPGHKLGLIPLAQDILRIRLKYGFRSNSIESAVNAKDAPKWIIDNLDSIKIIEKKAYNNHNFWENLKLAFTRIKPIRP